MYNPQTSSWCNPNIEYLFNNEIIEYDMKDAGMNIIQHYNLLDQHLINQLLSLEKMDRHINIGKLQKQDKDLSKALSEKFAEMRAMFISANNLSDNNIISVKKDAIYTIGPCYNLKFGKVEFTSKNIYSSYVRFVDNMNIEIYYSMKNIEVKGIGDSGVNRHRLYILSFINKIVSYIEMKDSSVKRFLKSFIDKYKRSELDDEYYVEFNNMSRELNPIYNYQKVIIPLVHITLKEME